MTTRGFNNYKTVSNPNFNDLTEAGVYYITEITSATNAPQTDYGYLFMIVLNINSVVCQVIFGGRQDAAASKKIWVRYYNAPVSAWKNWLSVQLS